MAARTAGAKPIDAQPSSHRPRTPRRCAPGVPGSCNALTEATPRSNTPHRHSTHIPQRKGPARNSQKRTSPSHSFFALSPETAHHHLHRRPPAHHHHIIPQPTPKTSRKFSPNFNSEAHPARRRTCQLSLPPVDSRKLARRLGHRWGRDGRECWGNAVSGKHARRMTQSIVCVRAASRVAGDHPSTCCGEPARGWSARMVSAIPRTSTRDETVRHTTRC